MNFAQKLINAARKNDSLLCVGLDPDPELMPDKIGTLEFNRAIIEATSDLVCAYKLNFAFYEALGEEGFDVLKGTVGYMPNDVPVIGDAKRGDIGNTAAHYAKCLFDVLNAEWVTLSPYMGYDSMRPFLEYKDRGVFVLCLTSNSGAKDFQLLDVNGKPFYAVVAEKVAYWNKDHNCGLVVGATHPEQLISLRNLAGDMPLLIPGVGAQGGSLEAAALNGTDNFRKTAVINVSRSVLYASHGEDFAQKARAELIKLNGIISSLRSRPDEAEEPEAAEDNSQPSNDQQSS